MGCNVSSKENTIVVKQRRNNDFGENEQSFTKEDKEVVQNSWQTLKLYIANIGVLTYVSMFENRPELIKTFSKFEGKDIENLQDSGLLQKHALRVMATIEKCVTFINDPRRLIHILREVGHHHKMNKVQAIDIQIILPHFLWAIKPYIQDKWCDKVQTAWTNFLTFIVYHIKCGMEQKRVDGVNILENVASGI